MNIKLFLSIMLFGIFCLACQPEQNKSIDAVAAPISDSLEIPKDTMPLPQHLDSFQTLTVAGHQVDIAMPDSAYKGNLIILQGYNFPKHDWCAKAPELCQQAKAAGYVLIMPEMGRSVYSSQLFPETLAKMKKYPLRQWLTDSVFNYLQTEYHLLLEKQNNFIIGLSTGARGVALVSLDRPELFNAVAALSGDYDQAKMPTDRIMSFYYGACNQFKERWETVDNVIHRIKEWKTPIYLGHDQLDKVVPPQQTRLFYDSLMIHFDSTKVILNEPSKNAHTYKYWASETTPVLDFFKQYENK